MGALLFFKVMIALGSVGMGYVLLRFCIASRSMHENRKEGE